MSGILAAVAFSIASFAPARVPKADFHDAMRKLWEDHVTWTRLYIVSAAAGLPDTASVPAAATRAPSATSAAPAPTNSTAAIAEGLTPEGYHFLGRADAPVTLVMYSDFL